MIKWIFGPVAGNALCKRRISVEQMTGLTRRYGRWTERLRSTLARSASLASRAGARMTSPPTSRASSMTPSPFASCEAWLPDHTIHSACLSIYHRDRACSRSGARVLAAPMVRYSPNAPSKPPGPKKSQAAVSRTDSETGRQCTPTAMILIELGFQTAAVSPCRGAARSDDQHRVHIPDDLDRTLRHELRRTQLPFTARRTGSRGPVDGSIVVHMHREMLA